jgi:hypothetical protein
LLLEIIERIISRERTVSDGYDQEERRVVVDKLFVFFPRRIKYYDLRVAIVLYPSLVNIV